MTRLDELYDQLSRVREDVAVIRSRVESIPLLERRVSTLEAWRWRLIGAVVAAGIAGGAGGPIWDALIR